MRSRIPITQVIFNINSKQSCAANQIKRRPVPFLELTMGPINKEKLFRLSQLMVGGVGLK